MNFIKKNMTIIVPAGIAVAAIILFIPTSIMRGKIEDNMNDSISQAKSIESLIRSATSARQYEVVKSYQDQHQQDANEVTELAVQSSRRELLSYKIFPKPNEVSKQIFGEFRQNYARAFEDLILSRLGALDAPTDAEIKKASGDVEISPTGRSSRTVKSSGQDAKIISLIYKKRAETVPVYAHPNVLGNYSFWDEWSYKGVELAASDSWYSQIAYWIHEDVIDSIAAMNAASSSVFDSPVKRLLGVGFGSSDATEQSKSSSDLPDYITKDDSGLAAAWTGRACDDEIDVVHFSVAAVVGVRDVLRFVQQLCSEKQHSFRGYAGDEPALSYKHNQITVLQCDVETIERDSPEHSRYQYGDDAVVRVDIVCEYIFNRAGYDKIKPESIKRDLGQLEEVKAPKAEKSRKKSKKK